ncbi:MAG: T9SS type A sorting domain-containing protein [Chitinophagales bacterium]|nr:T9SS type A sorting domain-containing protein [Chitinophagales bacterium]
MHRLLWLLLLPATAQAQLPFQLLVTPVTGLTLPGLHSYAKAQHDHYWLLTGGRTDGLHSMFPNSAFPFEEQNHHFVVIDTQTWTYYSSPLHHLPEVQRFSLATTNQQFVQDGNKLYVVGGYGFDSVGNVKKTFPVLNVITVDSLIAEVVSGGTNTAAYVRHVTDTFFAVTGGRLEKLDSVFLLIGGQYFAGQYTKLSSELFTQRYTNAVCRFQLDENENGITLKNVFCTTDSVLLHRRDLNSCGWMTDDGQQAVAAYGGVFRYDADLPYQWPIYVRTDSLWVDTAFEQQFSQYTCPVFCLYDSLTGNRYTVFLAGISLYDYDELSESKLLDTFVPFINDGSVLIHHADGSTEELVIGGLFPERGLANAEFFANPQVSRFANGVIRLHELNEPTLLGYAFGGINATAGNFGFTYASNTVWRIWLIPGSYSAAGGLTGPTHVFVAGDELWVILPPNQQTLVALYDLHGRRIMQRMAIGERLNLGLKSLPSGIYVLRLEGSGGSQAYRIARMH